MPTVHGVELMFLSPEPGRMRDNALYRSLRCGLRAREPLRRCATPQLLLREGTNMNTPIRGAECSLGAEARRAPSDHEWSIARGA